MHQEDDDENSAEYERRQILVGQDPVMMNESLKPFISSCLTRFQQKLTPETSARIFESIDPEILKQMQGVLMA